VFANVLLADEINRTPPKTQAALLQAMQEHQVTAAGKTYPLPDPFFVLATQNPIEQEGTYTLPEAQQDRFMFKVFVDYPGYDEEYQIAQVTTSNFNPHIDAVLSADQIIELQSIVRRVPAAPHAIHYALRLVRATRVQEEGAPPFVKDYVSWGAGPRGVQYLLLAGKAKAVSLGRSFVSTDDIKSAAHPVLRHRIITNFNAESEGVTADDVIDRLLETTAEEGAGEALAPAVARAFTR
jgi:MoxR-like ATPase